VVGALAGSGRLRACPDQRVARQGRVSQLGCRLGTGEGKPFGIDQTGLDQTLVQVKMFAGTLPPPTGLIATAGISILCPVGAIPGRMQSITRSCVNVISISSTIWSSPVVRPSLIAPMTSVWAVDYNPGNSGGGHEVIGVPRYPLGGDQNPALTTGSRDSVTSSTLTVENPTVPGATGETIVRGDHSTISGDRRATIEQKTEATASDAHRCRSS